MRKNILEPPKLCSLPPTSASFYQIALRAHYQLALWRNALDPHPPALAPTDPGWSSIGGSTVLLPTIIPQNKTPLWHRRNCSLWLNVGVTAVARAPQGDVDASLKALDVHCFVCAKEVVTLGTVTEESASQMDCNKHALLMLPVCKWIGWSAPLHQCKICAFSIHIPLIQFYHGFAYTKFVFDTCINSKIWYIYYTATLKIMWSLYSRKYHYKLTFR